MTNKAKKIGMGLITSFALLGNTVHAKPAHEVFEEIEKNNHEYYEAVEEMDQSDAEETQKVEIKDRKVVRQLGLYEHYIKESKEEKLQMIVLTAPVIYEEVKSEGKKARKALYHAIAVTNKLLEGDDAVYKSCRILLHTFDKLKEDKQTLENLYDKTSISKDQYQKASKYIAQKSQDKTLQAKIKTCKKQYGDAL